MDGLQFIKASFGGYGDEFITDTLAHTGNFIAIKFVLDSVIASITYVNPSQVTGTTKNGMTFSAGDVYYAQISSITLTSGKAIAYKGI